MSKGHWDISRIPVESDLSTSRNEDRHEDTSRHVLTAFLENIVGFPGYLQIQSKGLGYNIDFYVPDVVSCLLILNDEVIRHMYKSILYPNPLDRI
jgi:hypothetical protein